MKLPNNRENNLEGFDRNRKLGLKVLPLMLVLSFPEVSNGVNLQPFKDNNGDYKADKGVSEAEEKVLRSMWKKGIPDMDIGGENLQNLINVLQKEKSIKGLDDDYKTLLEKYIEIMRDREYMEGVKEKFNNTSLELSEGNNKGGYYIEGGELYYQGEKLEEANPESFKLLMGNYGKDNNNIYYAGEVIEGADPETFEVLHPVWSQYGKDKNNVYKYGEIIDKADPESFIVLGKEYTKDKNYVYHNGDIIEGADPETFGYDLNDNSEKVWSDKDWFYKNGMKDFAKFSKK